MGRYAGIFPAGAQTEASAMTLATHMRRRSFIAGAKATGLSLLVGNIMANAMSESASVVMPAGVPPLLDHLVWLAGDLDAACAQFEAMSGIKPQYGGAHPSGTHNALVSLGEQVYLEIAAPVAGAQVGHPWVDAARRRPEPHLYAYCMRSADPLDKLAVAVKETGLRAFGPSKGSRTTPDGLSLHWDLFIPIVPGAGRVVPFLIDWQDTPHPAQTTSSAASLIAFGAFHPEPARIRDAMALLAPGVVLAQREDQSDLVAELSTPRGPVRLSG